MFSSYFDVIIMRSPIARLAESCAYLMNDLESTGSRSVPIVNAGSGADEHPTQALLDIYTLQRSFQFRQPEGFAGGEQVRRAAGAEGLRRADEGPRAQDVSASAAILVAGGPCGRWRCCWRCMRTCGWCSSRPNHPKLAMRDDLRERLKDRNVRFYEFDSFEETLDGKPVIEQLDALYMTRIQKEHNDPQDAASMAAIDFSRYCLTPELVGRMKEYAPILHPFPARSAFWRDSAGDRQ